MQIAVYSKEACQPALPAEISALPSLLQSTNTVVWVDMIGPTPEDVRLMREVFRFHPLAIEDTGNMRQRPKVEEYNHHLFSILNPVRCTANNDVVFGELDVFVGPNYMVTVRQPTHGAMEMDEHEQRLAAEVTVKEVHHRIDEVCSVMPMSTGYLLYTLLDVVVDGYFPILDSIGDELDEIGDRIFEKPSPDELKRLFTLKRSLSEMWRVAGGQRDMFTILMRENSEYVSGDVLRYYLRDIHDHLIRISDMVNTFRDTLTGVIELYMSAVSNRLNKQVTRLTIITLGTGILAVITGFYGMNFERTWPPFNAPWGVPFVIGLILTVLATIAFIVLRQRQD